MNRKIVSVITLMIAAGVLLAGCQPHGHATASASSAKAHASAFATSSAGQFDKKTAQALAKKCFPQSSAGLVTLMRPTSGGQQSRAQVITCLKVPQKNKPAFETELWNDTMALVTSGDYKDKGKRHQFTEVTVPQLVVKYGG